MLSGETEGEGGSGSRGKQTFLMFASLACNFVQLESDQETLPLSLSQTVDNYQPGSTFNIYRPTLQFMYVTLPSLAFRHHSLDSKILFILRSNIVWALFISVLVFF